MLAGRGHLESDKCLALSTDSNKPDRVIVVQTHLFFQTAYAILAMLPEILGKKNSIF
jgi:hypothetical protein